MGIVAPGEEKNVNNNPCNKTVFISVEVYLPDTSSLLFNMIGITHEY